MSATKELLCEVTAETEKLLKGVKALTGRLENGSSAEMLNAMSELRVAADSLEGLLPDELWPLPSYAEMMFMI